MRNRPHPHTLREIDPSTYITDSQEIIIATAIKNWLLSLPAPLRKAVLKRVVNPIVFRLNPTDTHLDTSIMRASINFPALLEITTVAVEAERQRLEESTGDPALYEKLLKYYDNLNVETILQNAGDGFMVFFCDCYLLGK